MAVAFVNYAEAGFNSGGSSISSTTLSTLTVSSGTNLVLIAKFVQNFSSIPAGLAMTWGAQSMTQIGIGSGGGNPACAIFGLVNPATGNQTLTVSWTTAAVVKGYVAAEVYSGVNQSGGTSSFANFTTNQATSTSVGVTVTSAVNDMVTALAANPSSSWGSPWTNSPNVDVWDDNGTVANAAASAYTPGASSSATVTFLVTSSALVTALGVDLVASSPDVLMAQAWM